MFGRNKSSNPVCDTIPRFIPDLTLCTVADPPAIYWRICMGGLKKIHDRVTLLEPQKLLIQPPTCRMTFRTTDNRLWDCYVGCNLWELCAGTISPYFMQFVCMWEPWEEDRCWQIKGSINHIHQLLMIFTSLDWESLWSCWLGVTVPSSRNAFDVVYWCIFLLYLTGPYKWMLHWPEHRAASCVGWWSLKGYLNQAWCDTINLVLWWAQWVDFFISSTFIWGIRSPLVVSYGRSEVFFSQAAGSLKWSRIWSPSKEVGDRGQTTFRSVQLPGGGGLR